MKVPHKGLDLAGILTIFIAVQPACQKEVSNANIRAGNPHRVVTISSSSTGVSNPCEVDFPVTLLRISKHHTIAWAAQDHDFWVAFDSNNSPIGTNSFKVPSGTETTAFPITSSSGGYFTYAVYDSDPSSNQSQKPCKAATDDRDTGLNVKP